MIIPGLDKALKSLDVMQNEMIPLLRRLAENTDRLVALAEEAKEREN